VIIDHSRKKYTDFDDGSVLVLILGCSEEQWRSRVGVGRVRGKCMRAEVGREQLLVVVASRADELLSIEGDDVGGPLGAVDLCTSLDHIPKTQTR
jgi:hypothetical protein